MAPGGVSPSLRYGSTCPAVGSADASETAAQTLAALGLRVRLTFDADASQALTPELTLLRPPTPLGAFSGALASVSHEGAGMSSCSPAERE